MASRKAKIEMANTKASVVRKFLAREDRIPGGIGDKARKKDFDPKQLQKGVKVELEHTKDKSIAEEIALDHLTEDTHYYDKLEKIEKHGKGASIWLEEALDDLWEPAVDWVHRNSADGKRRLFAAYKNLSPKARAALEQAVSAAVGGSLVAYRNLRSGNDVKRMGGMSLSLTRPKSGNTVAFRVSARDILLHPSVAGGDNPLNSKAFGHEKEIILKLDASPVVLKEDVARKLLAARPIPIDKSALRGVATRLEKAFLQACKVAMRTKAGQPIQWREVWGRDSHTLRNVMGENLTVDILITAGKSRGPGPFVDAGGYGFNRQTGRSVVIIKLNGSYSATEYADAAKTGMLHSGIYDILIHEMTHAADVAIKAKYKAGPASGPYTVEDEAAYYNDPKEVRAYMQQVVDEILRYGGKRENLERALKVFKGPRHRGIEVLLKNTETWPEIEKHLTRQNRNKILKAVYQALSEGDYLKGASGKEASEHEKQSVLDFERVAQKFLVSSRHELSKALMKWLARATQKLGVAEHTYVVGGAVRNWILKKPIKDVDVVIDSVKAGKDSDWLGKHLGRLMPVRTDLTTNQYGVAILTVKDDWELDGHNLKGEVIEIANARSESYGKGDDGGKGYKPTDVQPATIEQDMLRREFSFNTLMWRLLDLTQGPDKAEIIDLTGCGLRDLQEGKLKCPSDPDKTFSDDPTRILRAIKFTGKYGFKIPPDVAASIKRNVKKMKRMPWEAIGTILVENVLKEPTARKSLKQMKELGILDVVSEMVQEKKPFQKYLSNQLRKERRVQLLLDIMELGVPASTPLQFLDKKQQKELRQLTLGMPEDKASAFADKLIKPPVDNGKVIKDLSLPGPDRRHIAPRARTLILQEPALADNAKKLTDKVISTWALKMASETLVSKVASRYIGKVAREFTVEEWKTHKERHPGADPKNHTIKKPEDPKKEDDPKSSLKDKIKAVLAQAKGASKAMVQSIQDAPEKVQKFVANKEYRDQTMRQAAKTIKAAPDKIKKSVMASAKSELKAIFVEAPKILGTLAKEKRLPTKAEAKTLYGVGVYVAGTALALSGGTPMAAALAGAKAFGHSLGLHIGIKAASQYADETFLAYEAVESAATGVGVADALPLATGNIPGLNQLLDGVSRLLTGSENESHDMEDLIDILIENVADVLDGGISDEDMKKILEERY